MTNNTKVLTLIPEPIPKWLPSQGVAVAGSSHPVRNVESDTHTDTGAGSRWQLVKDVAVFQVKLLIDGARVSSERRVGPSATYADPATFEGIDVARGPGSVAYGSDAIGGVISVRTRRAEPRSPLAIRGAATIGAGIPEGRGTIEISNVSISLPVANQTPSNCLM